LDVGVRADRDDVSFHDVGNRFDDGQPTGWEFSALGRSSITSRAITPSGPISCAASRPATACTKTPAQAAVNGSRRLARSAPITPERTSPVPAVASADAPPRLTAASPPGPAMTLSSPLRTTIALASAAA